MKVKIEMNKKNIAQIFHDIVHRTTNLPEIHPNWALTLNDTGVLGSLGAGERT